MSDKQLANNVPGLNEIGLGKQGIRQENAYLDHIQGNNLEKETKLSSSLDSQIKTNLNCLDEVMFSNHACSKPRSTSINMNLIEGLREHEKVNSSEDIIKLSKRTFEGLSDIQLSVNSFPEGFPSVQLSSKGASTSVENDIDVDNNNLRSPPKYQQRQEHEYIPYQKDKIKNNIEEIEEYDTSSQQNKRKPKLLMIQLPNSRPQNRQGNLYNFMDSSPIKEIQSDSSSYRENFPQTQPVGFVRTSKGNGYDTVEALQNDEFTMMFQSNCPIKSPTIPKIKKKHNDHSSQQGSLSSPMKDSLDKLKDSTATFFKDSQQISQNTDISQKPIETLTGICQEEFLKKDEDTIEEQLCDPKQVEREAVPINKDAMQYGLTDIRSVRNYKVNAFRNRLNLQSQQQQLAAQSNLEGDRNSSGSQCFIPLMNEPVSLMEMQKNQNYNTVETPISGGGSGQRTMQRPRLSVPPLMPLGRPGYLYEPAEKQTGFESAIQEEGTSQIDVDAPSKRKFQRQLLRIKVNPENSYNKREENTETWDEVVSSDQGPAETILEPKARQGSSNFEDQYTIINQRPLGEGTSGCVYQCVKKSDDDTIYAVKVMRNVDEEMSKSIFQTFGIQYRLQHESVSRVYEVYYNENSQTVHYVMEYIPFRSLDSLLRDKNRTLKETDSSCIVQKLLKAVCYMEQRGVCHRDLKPENILISEDLTQIKIIDFGISKSFVKSQRVQHITQYVKHKMYTPTGTPSYKAPEILQGAGYTQLIDMWDVGVITYQLICKGKHPFKCASQTEQDQRIMTQNYDQTDEYWVKASINAKNFIKQLLRLNRYPAFEALKHPWIEQRKIDVADDDNNRNAIKLEKKQSNNTMTTSVPVHFQPRLFNTFNINVTNSEQNQRSDNNAENDQNTNTNNQSNEFDYPMGNLNAVVTTTAERQQSKEDGSSVISSNSGATPETTRKSNFGKMNNDSTPKPGLRKKHSIQSFSSTQDVVHVVMRQKLSESREKMMQFFLRANSIIKNLEEEQLKLEQTTHPGKTLKRTHSMEKQCDQPNSPHNSAAPFLGIDGLSILSSGGLFQGNSSSRINSPSAAVGGHPNSSNSQEDIQRCIGSPAGTPSAAGPAMQTSFHMSLFSKEAQSSFTSNKNGSQNLLPNINNHQNLDNSNTQSEGEKFNSSQLSQMPDFNSMKFSSLIARKNSQQQQQQQQQGSNARKSKVIQRRNSTLQTNSMEKSIIFIKEVIGELQETFGKEQLQKEGENTPSRKMKIGEYAELLKANNNHNNSKNEAEEAGAKTGGINLQFLSQHQQSNGEAHDNKVKNPIEKLTQQHLLAGALGNKRLSEKDQEKWKLIAENMENSDSDSDSQDNKSQDDSSSDSGTSSNSDSSEEDRTQSFDLDKFLIKQPDQLIEPEQPDIDPQKPILNAVVDNPQHSNNVESPEKHGNNKSKDSLTNIPLGFNPLSQSKLSSLTFSDAKNMGKTGGQGIFQSVPYVNYMSSSKDNIINKSLIELQGHQEDRQHQQPAIVMNTSCAQSSKENTHIHNRSAEQQQQQQQQSQKQQQNHQQSSHFHHSNSLAQMQSHHHKHHHHHAKHGKKNHKNNKVSDTQTKLIIPPIATEQVESQANQNNSQTSNINQTMSSNCSSCGLPNSMQQLQEQKIHENGNDEKLFKNKLAPIPKRGSNEMSFNDSMGDQNLSFIEMNQSKLVQSFFPNSEDQIPINHSVKKANYLFSMNISQTSSITAGNISLSNSGNNNTIRSFHGIPQGSNGSGIITNGHVDNTGGIQSAKDRGNNNNTSKFKWQQSEHNSSSGGSNSQFNKKEGKMDFDMSVSEQVSQGDFPLQISQKPFLDNSVFNSSYEATPSKKGQLQKQQPSSGENAQSESNSQSDNSNNTKNSLPIPVAESKPTSQDSSSSLCSSPQKHKQSGSQTGIIDGQSIPAPSKEYSLSGSEEESNKLIEKEIKNVPIQPQNERKRSRSRSRSPGNNSPAGISRHTGFRPTFYQQYNKQTSNYSTIIEESGETRSCLTSSLAASSKYEFDGTSTTSMGLKLNQTRSLTQMNQSIFERNENNAQSISINFYPPHPHIHHQNSLPAGHNQVVHSCDDPETPTGDKLLSNGLNDSPFRRAISISVKKLAAAGNKNKNKYHVGSRPSSIIGSQSNSKTHSPKITQSQVSQHSFDDFFGTMQKSAFFEEDQQQTAVSQESHHHFQGGPLTSIKEQEVLEILPQERHYSDTTNLSQQPPLLKHCKSSLKGTLSNENFFEAIAEIIKQNPEYPSTNNEQTKLDQ